MCDSDYHHHRQPILDKNRPHRLRYQYDMAGQLIKATSPHATTTLGYDPMGRLIKQYSSNDSHIVIQRDYAYDKVGQLTHIASKTRLTQLVPNKPTQTIVNHYQRNHQYGYDTIGRLVSHKLSDYQHHAGIQERFAFDPASNRVPLPSDSSQSSQALSPPSSQIDAKTKRPTSLITQGKKIGYVYDRHGRVQFKTIVPVDKAGNELAQSQAGLVGYRESLQLAYNTNGELSQSIGIKDEGLYVTTTTTLYFYDAFGRRIGKSSSVKKSSKLGRKGNTPKFGFVSYDKAVRQTILMLWDGNRQIQEYTKDHVFTTVYEQDSFVPVARVVWLQPNALEKANQDEQKIWQEVAKDPYPNPTFKKRLEHQSQQGIRIYHYHTDHLGTPQELTNALGEVVWLGYYNAWGELFDEKSFFNELYQTQKI